MSIDSILSLNSELIQRESSSIPSVRIPVSLFFKIMEILKTDSRFLFDHLQFHTALDVVNEDKFECLYLLRSSKLQTEILISVLLPRANPVIPSLCRLWSIAEWQEREVFDMFGVLYEGHPDLRRLFLEDDWKGFPLRKDYQDEFLLRRPW